MNPEQLKAMFAQHKGAVLGVAAAGVAGLALLRRKKSGGASAGGQPAGTIPATALAPTVGGYDSSAYDVYSALQSELSPILEQQRKANSITTAPNPVSSDLFKPGTFYARAGSHALYYLDPTGKLDFLENASTAKQLGANSKNITYVSKDSPLWALPRLDPQPKTLTTGTVAGQAPV